MQNQTILSNIFKRAGRTKSGQKIVITELSLDFSTGVTLADFHSSENLLIETLLVTRTVSSLPMVSQDKP